jgi:hypothetical protein
MLQTMLNEGLRNPETNHFSSFFYADRVDLNYNEAQFRTIWIMIILFNIIMDLLLFVSFIMCLIKSKSDFGKRDQYDMDVDDFNDDGEDIVIDKVEVQKGTLSDHNSEGHDGEGVGVDDGEEFEASSMTEKKGKSKSGSRSQAGKSKATTVRQMTLANRNSCCKNYWILFFLKSPMLNPIFAKH